METLRFNIYGKTIDIYTNNKKDGIDFFKSFNGNENEVNNNLIIITPNEVNKILQTLDTFMNDMKGRFELKKVSFNDYRKALDTYIYNRSQVRQLDNAFMNLQRKDSNKQFKGTWYNL